MDFLSHVLESALAEFPFTNDFFVLWVQCAVEDGRDALGCVLMGGEL